MKIYILTYSNRTFFSHDKRVSGIDVAAYTQFKILKELGHDVRMFCAQTDLDQHEDGIDYFINYRETDTKSYARKNKKNIEKKIIESIYNFKPDLIMTNYEFSKFYKKLSDLKIPITYVLHAMPGFWTDFLNANLLNELTTGGHTFCCVSDYHKRGTIKYYKSKRKDWNFDEIIPDQIFYPQYCDAEEINEPENIVRHVSAASKGKDTFLINKFLDGTNIQAETFTTLGHQSKDQYDDYVTDALEKYSKDIRIDVPHAEIMQKIGKAGVAFVGNYPDTFTITSLEALSRGVPLILKDKSGHPATEMVEPEFLKYLGLIKTKSQFLEKVDELMNIPMDERKKLAESVHRKMGKDNYKIMIQNILNSTIKKFNNTNRTDSVEEW